MTTKTSKKRDTWGDDDDDNVLTQGKKFYETRRKRQVPSEGVAGGARASSVDPYALPSPSPVSIKPKPRSGGRIVLADKTNASNRTLATLTLKKSKHKKVKEIESDDEDVTEQKVAMVVPPKGMSFLPLSEFVRTKTSKNDKRLTSSNSK